MSHLTAINPRVWGQFFNCEVHNCFYFSRKVFKACKDIFSLKNMYFFHWEKWAFSVIWTSIFWIIISLTIHMFVCHSL
jgi:hypothetical protein